MTRHAQDIYGRTAPMTVVSKGKNTEKEWGGDRFSLYHTHITLTKITNFKYNLLYPSVKNQIFKYYFNYLDLLFLLNNFNSFKMFLLIPRFLSIHFFSLPHFLKPFQTWESGLSALYSTAHEGSLTNPSHQADIRTEQTFPDLFSQGWLCY